MSDKKNILIDAKWLYEGPTSCKNVVENIIFELPKYFEQYDCYLLLDYRDIDNQKFYTQKGFQIITAWSGINFLSNTFLTSLVAKDHSIDVGIFQNFIPLWGDFKKIVYIHDIIYESNPEFFTVWERAYFYPIKFSTRSADRVITISQNEKKRLQKFNYADKEKIDVVYNGIDQAEVEKKEKIELIGDTKIPQNYILYVGRLNDRKNISNLIKSLEYVNDDLKLVIVGKKDWKNVKLAKLLEQGDLDNRFIFTGFVSDNELEKLYSNATIFAYVSLEEGFGLPPLEAMSYGIPVVVSNVSCIPEICGDAALYVDPLDPEKIANGINKIFSDRKLRNKLIEKGFKRIKKYNWSDSVEKIINIIDEL